MTTALLYHHLKTVLEFKIVDDQMTVTLLRRELCLAREDAPFLEASVRSDSRVPTDQKKNSRFVGATIRSRSPGPLCHRAVTQLALEHSSGVA